MTDDLAIPEFLDRSKNKPLVWSYTLLNTYKNICPYQTYRRYIKKDIPYQETPQMARGNAVHSAMEYRIGGGKPLPPDMQQYEPIASALDGHGAVCEQKIGVSRKGQITGYFAPDVWGRGKLDVTIIKDNMGYLGDHKTGKVREDPFELEVQAVLLHAKHPHLTKIVGQFFWLAEMQPGPIHDVSNTSKTWSGIQQTVEAIESNTRNGEWEKRRGGLCAWCDCFDCENNRKPR